MSCLCDACVRVWMLLLYPSTGLMRESDGTRLSRSVPDDVQAPSS